MSLYSRKTKRNKKKKLSNIQMDGGFDGIVYSGKIKTRKLKPVNCHPKRIGSKKNRLPNSCLTPTVVQKLKKAYNIHHRTQPEKQIHSNHPTEIYEKLAEKIPHCDQEICWLNHIPNKELQEKMKSELFSPIQPAEWKHKPNAWLSNYDIDAVIRQYEKEYKDFVFLGPTSIDFDKVKNGTCVLEELCHFQISKLYASGKRKIGVVYNLDTSDGPGTHWVSMFIDLKDSKPFLFYFNSTADNMPNEVIKLVSRIETQWNHLSHKITKGRHLQIYKSDGKTEHQHSNTECGMYSLFFIITCLTRHRGGLESSSELSRKELLDYFMGENRISDEFIQQFRNIYFNPI
jgi:hypothetical protein